MYEQLYKYLILNGKIFLPGVGSFVVETVPALVDDTIRVIRPSQQIVQFANTGENYFNNSLFSFLSKEINQTEEEVKSKFDIFIEQLKNSLQADEVELPAWGTLKKFGGKGNFTFIPEPANLKHLFPLIGLPTELGLTEKRDTKLLIEKQPRNNVEYYRQIVGDSGLVKEKKSSTTVEKKKDYWWVYAIVLMLIAAGGLIYYYLYYNI